MSRGGPTLRMTRLGVLLTVIAALAVFAPPAPAQIRIEVPKPGGAGVPIAISPLSNPDSHAERQIGETFASTIARDLTLFRSFPCARPGARISRGQRGLC